MVSAEMDWDKLIGKADDVRRVFENCPAMLVGYEGPHHRYLAVNAGYRALFPKFEHIGVGRRFVDVIPEIQTQHLIEIFDQVYRTGETAHAKEWRLHIDLDGSGTLQEGFYDFVASARRGPDGAVEGIQLVLYDVTERVRERMSAEARADEMAKRYARTRDSAVLMQRALLALAVPVLPAVDIAAEYLVATEDTAAGGDWFDAIPDDAGSVLLIVGDVVGHGVEAAAVMAQLRTATRLKLLAGSSIAETLGAVDDFSRHVPGSNSATLCIGRLDTATGDFEYCTAGHPPPLLIAADATPRYAEPSGAGPLGSGTGFPTKVETLDMGDVVLLYSDGLIERPGRSIAASTAELADLSAGLFHGPAFPIETASRHVDRLCSQTLELLLRKTGYSDDITLLAAQRRTPARPLKLTLDADIAAASVARAALRDWLSAIGTVDSDRTVIVHAISEFVENSVEHGYDAPTADGVVVQASLDDRGQLQASVIDHGRWKTASVISNGRGRGLMLADALLTDTQVVTSDSGTTARLTHRLYRPARIGTDPGIVPVAAQQRVATELVITVVDEGRLTVSGDIDNASVSTFAGRISRESRAGTVALTIDLSEVSHLGSAGLRALSAALDRSRRHGTHLTLIASPGSPAHHVLTLTQLPVSRRVGGDSVGPCIE